MNFVDTHTHLFLEQFDEDRKQVVNQAINAGVTQMVLPDIDSSTTQSVFELAKHYPLNCFPAVGLHPSSVKENYLDELKHVENIARNNKVYAIGEIGIDLYWDKTFIVQQLEAFRFQIKLAKELKLPIIIHAREAFNEVFAVLDDLYDDSLHGVFHSFAGTDEQAAKALSYPNFYLGIGGIVTFKNGGLDKVVPQIPMQRIVLETDSPYLAPTPHRGKRNTSSYIPLIAAKIADVKHISLAEVAEISTENARKLFALPTQS